MNARGSNLSPLAMVGVGICLCPFKGITPNDLVWSAAAGVAQQAGALHCREATSPTLSGLRVWSELAAAGANAGPDGQATMSKGMLGVGTHDR